MAVVLRKKSPRAPSVALGDAIEKVTMIYNKDRCHAAPLDNVAKHIGYKNAQNGAALGTMASLKYYGLLERSGEGMLSVSKDVEVFLYAPSEEIKQAQILRWLKSPSVFAELLDKYAETLPSDATLKFDLIQRGFSPAAADGCLLIFRKSVDYARYFESPVVQAESQLGVDAAIENDDASPMIADAPLDPAVSSNAPSRSVTKTIFNDETDRIPVRLGGGRRAWIEIPMPFYEADRERLKKQIDLLLTDDEEEIDDLL